MISLGLQLCPALFNCSPEEGFGAATAGRKILLLKSLALVLFDG